ncbi:MAG: PilZ domain-containing protein [Clostridiales bacterium]
MEEDIKLLDILKVGEIIKSKHCQSNNWVNNIIMDIDDKNIKINLGMDNEYVKSIVMVGDTIKCKYYVKHKEYVLVGWITDIEANFPQKLVIRIHDIELYENQREFKRYDVYICSVIKKRRTDKKGIFTIMTNVSSGGAAFSLKKDISEDFMQTEKNVMQDIYFFEIYISNEVTLIFQGEIVRRTKRERGLEYGVKLIDIDNENTLILDNYIKELENKDKEIYNKSSFWTKNSKFYKGEKNG